MIDFKPVTNLKVTPQTIIWMVGAMNVFPTRNKDEYEITASGGIPLRYKNGGKRVEAWTFSGAGHKTHPEAVRLRPFLLPTWVPMSAFVIPGDEIPEGFLTQKKSPGDKPLEDIVRLAGHVA